MKVPENCRLTREMLLEIYEKTGLDHYLRKMQLELLLSDASYGNAGAFFLPAPGKKSGRFFFCIVSDEMDWDHVSVTIPTESRCPTWNEMCYIKDQFWDKSEAVIQIHPAGKDYVNYHPYCLHLWRSTKERQPLPHPFLVGIKSQT